LIYIGAEVLDQAPWNKANQKLLITGSIIASAAAKFKGAPVIKYVQFIAITNYYCYITIYSH